MARIRQDKIAGMEVFILEGEGRMAATVAPGFGAVCSSLRFLREGEALELFHEANDLSGRRMGGRNPVLFPAVGRLFLDGELGRYRHRGKAYSMDIHGFAKDLPWRVVSAQVDRSRPRLICELDSSAETRAAYPYDFLLRVTHIVEPSALRLEAEIENRSPEPMPFSFGWHPYFRAPICPDRSSRGQCVIRIPGDCFWEMSEGAPTGRLLPLPQALDFRTGVSLPQEHLEWVVANLDGPGAGQTLRAELIDRGSGVSVAVGFDAAQLETVTVYSPAGAPYACVEPRTGIPMALSDDTLAPRTGQILAPAGQTGSRMRIPVVISAETL